MDTNQLFSGEGDTTDLGSQLPDLTSSINDMLAPIMWLSVAISIVFIVLYISAMFRRRKLENALFDMQKTLHEINERDKARSTPAAPTVQPQVRHEKDTIIARSDEPRREL